MTWTMQWTSEKMKKSFVTGDNVILSHCGRLESAEAGKLNGKEEARKCSQGNLLHLKMVMKRNTGTHQEPQLGRYRNSHYACANI
jgi:hypothetical protein